MSYLRRYLIFLRRANNDGLFGNLKVALGLASLLLVLIGMILDFMFSSNLFLNGVKGLISILGGLSMFSFGYLYNSSKVEKILDSDRYYNPIRNRYSHKQRVNISTLVISVLSIILIIGDPESAIYTLKSILFVFLLLTMIAFARKQREEFIKGIYEFPDLKDMETRVRINREKEALKNKDKK